jgi:polysaccharide export outer membrane protein
MRLLTAIMALVCAVSIEGGCARGIPAEFVKTGGSYDFEYVVGPGDSLAIFVWGAPDLSVEGVVVRPDGKISVPLVEDLVASGRTASELARDIESVMSTYVRNPLVTVLVGDFQGVYDTQIRVIGEIGGGGDAGFAAVGGGGAGAIAGGARRGGRAATAVPYTANMTVLDVVVAIGGISEFAAGNRTKLIRTVDGEQHQFRIRLGDLVERGDMTANVRMAPGDVLFVPEAWF